MTLDPIDLIELESLMRRIIREEVRVLTTSSAGLAEPASLRQRVIKDAENHSRQLAEKRAKRAAKLNGGQR